MSENGNGFEKGPLASKKFVAFLVAETTWKVLAILALVMGIFWDKVDVILASILLAVVIIAGFVETAYIGKQADLDRYTRLAMPGIKEAASGLRGGEPPDTKADRPDRKEDRE